MNQPRRSQRPRLFSGCRGGTNPSASRPCTELSGLPCTVDFPSLRERPSASLSGGGVSPGKGALPGAEAVLEDEGC